MGPPAPWPSSLLYCSLAKHWLPGCAMWEHVHHEIARIWAQHQDRKVRTEEESRTEGCVSLLAPVQMRCASNDTFSPLPCWGDAVQWVLLLSLGRKMWLQGCLIQLGPRIHGESESNGEMNCNSSSAQQQLRRSRFSFSHKLQIWSVPFLLLIVKRTEKQTLGIVLILSLTNSHFPVEAYIIPRICNQLHCCLLFSISLPMMWKCTLRMCFHLLLRVGEYISL